MDRLSLLPDGILIDIVSCLKIKEVICTSILSKRWKDIWMFCKSLKFDDQFCGGRYADKYIERVDRVLESNKCPKLDEFIVRPNYLSETRQEHVDKWVKYAFAKRVQKLTIANCSSFPNPLDERFSTDASFCNGLRFIRELHLRSIRVSEATLQHLVRNCPLLEWLIVQRLMNVLEKIEISGPSINLKHLHLVACGTRSIKLSNMDLVTLVVIYSGKVELCNMPMLRGIVVFGGGVSFDNSSQLSCSSSNLKYLTTTISTPELEKKESPEFPELGKLHLLEMDTSANNNQVL